MSNLNKDVLLNLENSAYYQDRERLNVKFSTADRDSAVFYFNVTKDKKPYLLGEENVKGHVAFLHSDKSFVKDELEFNEEFNKTGQFKITVPNELIKRNGTITMQVFITEVGNSNTVVAERIVEFETEDSLIRQLSGETILQYIVEYDELQDFVKSRMDTINEQIANAEDYVTAIEEAREKGLSDIEIAKATSIQEINTLADTKLQQIRTKGDEYSTKFDEDKSYMDEKLQDFRESVKGSDVVTTGQSKNWQKFKLTDDDGTYPLIDLQSKTENYYSLKTGIYYTTNTPHGISGVSTAGFSEMKIRQGTTVKRLTFRPYNSNRIFEKWFYNEWSNWSEIVTLNSNEEIVKQESLQTQLSNLKQELKTYTDEKHKVLFDGSASGVGTTIGLTDDYTKYSVLFLSGSYPGGAWETLSLTAITNSIVVSKTNLVDSDASGGGDYEMILRKTDNKTLTIALDNYMEITSNKGYTNANKFTIQRIEGWK